MNQLISRPRGTLVTDLLSGRPCVRRVRLRVEEGPDTGREVEVSDLSVLVGSHPDTDLHLTDPLVSRQHLEIRLADDGVEVRDLESKNGTFLGDNRLERAIIAPGARIRLGDTHIIVDAIDEPWDLGIGQSEFGGLAARSPRMQEVFALLSRVARSDASVLLEGETGVGKDVMARAIHAESARSTEPFLVLDCGSVSRELIASELFGHRRGAFTGAVSDRVGIFEAARGGTVFLDELGELNPELQPALLRVLESRTVTRVGENKARPVDVRVVAATNRRLREEVVQGTFREDLYYRLAVVQVLIPPLRERPEDIPALAEAFLERAGWAPGTLTDREVSQLLSWSWPGNVRELKNLIERSALLSGERFVLQRPQASPAGQIAEARGAAPARLPAPRASVPASSSGLGPDEDLLELPYKEARAEALQRFERRYLAQHLKEQKGNVSRLADRVGLARAYVHRLLTRHGIDRTEARDRPLGEER